MAGAFLAIFHYSLTWLKVVPVKIPLAAVSALCVSPVCHSTTYRWSCPVCSVYSFVCVETTSDSQNVTNFMQAVQNLPMHLQSSLYSVLCCLATESLEYSTEVCEMSVHNTVTVHL